MEVKTKHEVITSFIFILARTKRTIRHLRTKFLSHDTVYSHHDKINFLSPAVKIKQEEMKQNEMKRDVVSNSCYLMKFRFILTFP